MEESGSFMVSNRGEDLSEVQVWKKVSTHLVTVRVTIQSTLSLGVPEKDSSDITPNSRVDR